MKGDLPEPEPRNGFFVEGIVLDGETLAPVAGAEVVATTARRAYALVAHTGASGRFELTITNVVKRYSSGEALIAGILLPWPPTPAETTERFTIAARAGRWCALPRTYRIEDRQVVLYVRPCPESAMR